MRWPILLLLFFGAAYTLAVPLFEAPDEPAHFARAYGISEGQLILRDSPRHLAVFIHEKLKNRKHLEKMVSMMDRLLAEHPRRVPHIAPNAAMYSPIPYLFHALVIKTATAFGHSNFILALSVYLCRLTSLFLFVSVLYFSFRMIPDAFRPVFWIAATPMALSQAATVSVDFVVLGACVILLAASLGDLEYPAFAWWATAAAFFLLLTKPPYAPLLLLPAVSAVFVKKTNWMQGSATLAGIFLIPFLGALMWNQMMVSHGFMDDFRELLIRYADINTDPIAQLAFIKTHPVQFVRIVWHTLYSNGVSYYHQFVGVLGWLDVPIPFWTAVIWGVPAIAAVRDVKWTDFDFRIRLLLGITCLLVSVLLIISVSASAYMVWMPVASDWINMQGRYFHPVAAVFLMGMALVIPWGESKRTRKVLRPVYIGAACIIHTVSLLTVWQHYRN